MRNIFIFQKHLDEVPEVKRLLMQSKAAPDMETLREITKSLNPDTVKDLIDAAGVSKVCGRMNMVEHIRGRLIKLFTVRGGALSNIVSDECLVFSSNSLTEVNPYSQSHEHTYLNKLKH